MSRPSLTGDLHLAVATQMHVDLDWAEFKRHVHSDILECYPLGGECCEDASYAGIFFQTKSKLVLGNLPDGVRMLLSGSSALCMHITGPEKNPLYSFCYSFTKPSTFIALFSCLIWKDKGGRGLIMLLTLASACYPLKQAVVWGSESWIHAKDRQRQSFLLKWRMLRPQVILSIKTCWSDRVYNPLECIQGLWHKLLFWAYMFWWEIRTNHNTSAQAVKLFIALRLAIPVAKWMNQTLRTWFWSAAHHYKLQVIYGVT